MNKYRSLDTLLLALSPALTTGQLAVAESWRDDEQSLGLVKPGVPGLAAYVFIHGQAGGRYGVHLEYPPDIPPGAVVSSAEDLSLRRLWDLLAAHFELDEIHH